jgi:hypothetical protein
VQIQHSGTTQFLMYVLYYKICRIEYFALLQMQLPFTVLQGLVQKKSMNKPQHKATPQNKCAVYIFITAHIIIAFSVSHCLLGSKINILGTPTPQLCWINQLLQSLPFFLQYAVSWWGGSTVSIIHIHTHTHTVSHRRHFLYHHFHLFRLGNVNNNITPETIRFYTPLQITNKLDPYSKISWQWST